MLGVSLSFFLLELRRLSGVLSLLLCTCLQPRGPLQSGLSLLRPLLCPASDGSSQGLSVQWLADYRVHLLPSLVTNIYHTVLFWLPPPARLWVPNYSCHSILHHQLPARCTPLPGSGPALSSGLSPRVPLGIREADTPPRLPLGM